jgi:uncharacterized membrane protein (UPF0127 family)
VRSAVAAFILCVLLAGCTGMDNAPSDGASDSQEEEATGSGSTASGADLAIVEIETSGGERVEVRAEIADDLIEQSRGLMHRTALAEDRGMLFVYDEERDRSFWMKNTQIPLSIAYMDSEGRIVDIQDMKPLDDDPPHYVSAEPARYALEVNRGFFEERNVEVGDTARLPD